MKEYKFRGKREDANVWVFGYVFKTAKANPWSDETTWIFNEERKFKVEPETVGQYITRDDKNGVEIYEDDILHYEGHFYHITSNWRNRGKSIKTEVNGNFTVKYEDNTGFQMYHQGIGYYKIHSVDVEVIGNIHENPELLESHT